MILLQIGTLRDLIGKYSSIDDTPAKQIDPRIEATIHYNQTFAKQPSYKVGLIHTKGVTTLPDALELLRLDFAGMFRTLLPIRPLTVLVAIVNTLASTTHEQVAPLATKTHDIQKHDSWVLTRRMCQQ